MVGSGVCQPSTKVVNQLSLQLQLLALVRALVLHRTQLIHSRAPLCIHSRRPLVCSPRRRLQHTHARLVLACGENGLCCLARTGAQHSTLLLVLLVLVLQQAVCA